ncbi:hypothetical protein SAMD00019534_107220 [Acytostelium subglobosum LB1]|uniref:hypothetical protein n=1 Tax=Acytostelium subglobosum LB1 TaxID=1410327 RepID=UPI0006448D06|nr:hypothetical protein SAMD00019534_107220 [Acytostelium subglobosum LB1]GAM27546.1 hypothetical protein SAMD00019534_107220 [Acytostelium subglobosum LB1]|eukprot:XP_012749611.1 hypothetical protein SAMD00019534_107220 [Acytostelium subglobosum LB1]
MALIETYLTLSIVTIVIRIPHILTLDSVFNANDSTIKEIAKSHINLAVVVNTLFTLLIVFGKIIQYMFFGKLREIEERNFKERFLFYIVTKFFIFAVKDHELISTLMWGFWFAVQCFLKQFSLLARDRFEYLNTFSPNTHVKIHFKLLFLLVSIMFSDLACFYLSTSMFYIYGLSNLMILNFEFFTIFFETIQTLVKYSIHLFDMAWTGVWEKRGQYIYFAEFVSDSIILAGTCFHLIHIVIIQGMPTLLDLVLFSYFKGVFTELRRKINGYRNYCKLVEDMDTKYLNATPDELEIYNDDCAICRDRMDSAKKLPCGHIFHHSCLRSWLEQQTSCPTCRRSLIELQTEDGQPSTPRHNGQPSTSTFGHHGSTSTSTTTSTSNTPISMAIPYSVEASTVHEMFPDTPLELIRQDLVATNSVQSTINNILEGRLVVLESISEADTTTSHSTINSGAQQQQNIQNSNPVDQASTSSSPSSSSSSSSSSSTSRCIDHTAIEHITTNNNNDTCIDNTTNDTSKTTTTDSNETTDNNKDDNNSDTTTTPNNNNSLEPLEPPQPLEKFADSFKSTAMDRHNSLMQRKKLMLEASRRMFLEEIN